MALIVCPECKKKVSETASNCPKCGYQLTPEKISEIKKNEQQAKKVAIGCLSVIGILLIILFLIVSISLDSLQEIKTIAPRTQEKSGSSGVEVSKEQYRDQWPFTVDKGVVDCVDGQAAIFKVGGKIYQLNGFARSRGYSPIDPIWRDNPDLLGTNINIGPMIDLALKQCN